MKNQPDQRCTRGLLSLVAALGLLAIFVGLNYYFHERSLHAARDQANIPEREQLTDTAGFTSRRLTFHDFEWGNPADTASHLVTMGHGGKQSLEMSSKVPFSPGLWVKFKELNPADPAWIRATGWVWFSCPPTEAKCSMVVTCNHNGTNFKYMFIPIEKEAVMPNQWNRISIDYRIPSPPDREDVLQAYFWYRGSGEMLVDDIEVTYLTMKN